MDILLVEIYLFKENNLYDILKLHDNTSSKTFLIRKNNQFLWTIGVCSLYLYLYYILYSFTILKLLPKIEFVDLQSKPHSLLKKKNHLKITLHTV
jgi:hypothetical protein